MQNDQPNITREKKRIPIIGEKIQGFITISEKNMQTLFVVRDVSSYGIGIETSEKLSPGSSVIITMAQPYLLVVESKVIWCEKSSTCNFYRCGLAMAKKSKVIDALIAAFQSKPRAQSG